jgi:hypothetical protein
VASPSTFTLIAIPWRLPRFLEPWQYPRFCGPQDEIGGTGAELLPGLIVLRFRKGSRGGLIAQNRTLGGCCSPPAGHFTIPGTSFVRAPQSRKITGVRDVPIHQAAAAVLGERASMSPSRSGAPALACSCPVPALLFPCSLKQEDTAQPVEILYLWQGGHSRYRAFLNFSCFCRFAGGFFLRDGFESGCLLSHAVWSPRRDVPNQRQSLLSAT